MRILHVLETCGAGGIETTFANVLRVWRARTPWADHEVLAAAGGVLEDTLRQSCVAVLVAASAESTIAALSRRYDVIHFLSDRMAWQWLPFVVARSAAAVVYGKGYDTAGTFRLNDGLRWQPDESLMSGCDAVTFTTAALADGYAAPAHRMTVLGKAADTRHFLNLPGLALDTPPRIVCVANLHALKRLGDLVRAVARLRVAHPEVRLRLVGEDRSGEGRRLRALAESLGVGEICELVGRRADVAADLRESAIFALPSSREGVPTAMLEAMAAARPVVVTNVGHVRTVVRDGVEGFLVAAGDIDALTARLDLLLRDRAMASTMGFCGRRTAAAFDVESVADRWRDALVRAGASLRPGAAA